LSCICSFISEMKLTIALENGDIKNVEADANQTVEELKCVLEVELGVPQAQMDLLLNGAVLQSGQLLTQCGVTESDVLLLRVRPLQQPAVGAAAQANPFALPGNQAPGVDPRLVQLFDAVQADPSALGRLKQFCPAAGEAVDRGDRNAFFQAVMEKEEEHRKRLRDEQARLARIMADPLSVEAQEEMFNRVKQANIQHNMEQAIEFNPESFGSVVMLYVNSKVNGVDVKAFVDSGAQTTIMSRKTAERCNILHLMDTRFQGIAQGVGTSKILGRIHMTDLQLGSVFVQVAITVLENDSMDFLLGLDQLRRHQCCIDLGKNVLRIEGEDIPFLAEKDIPKSLTEGSSPRVGSSPKQSESGQSAGVSGVPSAGTSAQPAGGIPANVSSSSFVNPSSNPQPTNPSSAPTMASIPPASNPQPQAPPSGSGTLPGTGPALNLSGLGMAPAGAQPPRGSQTARPVSFPQEHVKQLMDLGFSEQQAVRALTQARGNVDVAAAILFG